MPNDWTRRLAAHGKHAPIAFRPPFRCEVHRMMRGRHQGHGRARLRKFAFRVDQVLRSHRSGRLRRGYARGRRLL